MSDDHGWSDISRCATSDALDVVLAFVFFVFIRLLNPINVDPSYTSMRLFLPNGAYRFRFGNGETGRSKCGFHTCDKTDIKATFQRCASIYAPKF